MEILNWSLIYMLVWQKDSYNCPQMLHYHLTIVCCAVPGSLIPHNNGNGLSALQIWTHFVFIHPSHILLFACIHVVKEILQSNIVSFVFYCAFSLGLSLAIFYLFVLLYLVELGVTRYSLGTKIFMRSQNWQQLTPQYTCQSLHHTCQDP